MRIFQEGVEIPVDAPRTIAVTNEDIIARGNNNIPFVAITLPESLRGEIRTGYLTIELFNTQSKEKKDFIVYNCTHQSVVNAWVTGQDALNMFLRSSSTEILDLWDMHINPAPVGGFTEIVVQHKDSPNNLSTSNASIEYYMSGRLVGTEKLIEPVMGSRKKTYFLLPMRARECGSVVLADGLVALGTIYGACGKTVVRNKFLVKCTPRDEPEDTEDNAGVGATTPAGAL